MNESQWFPIPGYNGFYEITREGLVRSWRARGGSFPLTDAIAKTPKLMSATQTGTNPQYILRKNNIPEMKTVGWLLLTTFVGEQPPSMEAVHLDGDGFNNRLDNLRWMTTIERLKLVDEIHDHQFRRGARNGSYLGENIKPATKRAYERRAAKARRAVPPPPSPVPPRSA